MKMCECQQKVTQAQKTIDKCAHETYYGHRNTKVRS
nr:MAG TPA: hypothetical protein [Caudoviricetes sp.]